MAKQRGSSPSSFSNGDKLSMEMWPQANLATMSMACGTPLSVASVSGGLKQIFEDGFSRPKTASCDKTPDSSYFPNSAR